jgi:stearoyl-CoA desaturase (delta-9 desaturase)
MNTDWLYGLVPLTFLGYVALSVVMVQTTLMAMTLYLHRDATHRSIDLHPALRHFFRFWIWMTSSILTREWVAVHRKHHALTDREGDPHSPVMAGLHRILLEGTEHYRREARNPCTLEQYGNGTPDDWIEQRIYSRYRNAGIVGFVILSLVLFGVPGIILIAVQMISMPVMAAGVINGLGHSAGYRNYEVDNAATNIVPWGILIGGEELHNNHHAFPASAKFSVRAWEFDVGWLYIVMLRSLGLAQVRRLAPQPRFVPVGREPDPDAVHAVIRNRMHVLRAYALQVVAPILEREVARRARRASRKLLTRSPALLDARARERLVELLDTHPRLKTVHEAQERLRLLWEKANLPRENLMAMFKGWCAHAEASGIDALTNFAATLRAFAFVPEKELA